MSFETYHQIAYHEEDRVLRSNCTAEYSFTCNAADACMKHRLYFKGETALFYFWKNEPDCSAQYNSIEDSLDNAHAFAAPFCLNLSSQSFVKYERLVYKKLLWPPTLSYLKLHSYTDNWQGGIFVKTNGLSIGDGGYARMRFEVRLRRDGRSERDVSNEPDSEFILNFPERTYDWTRLFIHLNIPSKATASVCCFVEACNYYGEIYLEQPFLVSENNYNILPDFAPCYPAHEQFAWIGINLSKKEWPSFEIRLNGNLIYDGELFERCHRYSEFECDVPNGCFLKGENRLIIKYTSSYPGTVPFKLKEVGYFLSENGMLSIVSCPVIAQLSHDGYIAITTGKHNMTVSLQCASGAVTADTQTFEKRGLNFFRFRCCFPLCDVAFSLQSEGIVKKGVLKRIVSRQEDHIYTGSGDFIYVNHESSSDLNEYLAWFFSEHIGNLITLRPVYRWGGGRSIDATIWQELNEVLNKTNTKYSLMIDGRDLPGLCCNPTVDVIGGEHYLGRQAHEYDGAYLYWKEAELQNQSFLEARADLELHLTRRHMDTAYLLVTSANYLAQGDRLYRYRVPNAVDDVESAANLFVDKLKASRYDQERHTGPSTAFRYFFQAGYKWAGAELMYGPAEIVIAALRGAAKCYNQDSLGGHLAVQWSTTPHDSASRYRRYRTMLYVCYMQGLTEINTEEGFWHLEEYYTSFGRKDLACKNHLKQQQDFYEYVASHSRSGAYYSSFAFLFGRFDGWRSFGSEKIWGQSAFDGAAPEKSWELLRLFYPLTPSENMIFRHPCPDEEVGFHSGTPIGNADIVPIECALEKLCVYKTLCFAGYNKLLEEDAVKLLCYVRQGGTLILGWPHLTVTTNRSDIISGNLQFTHNALTDAVCSDPADFCDVTIRGRKGRACKSVMAAEDEIIERSSQGIPLVLKKRIGNGTLFFVNLTEYPAELSVRPVYERLILECVDRSNQAEKSFISCDNDVQFTIYDQPDGSRNIYVMAVDWYNPSTAYRKAVLRLMNTSTELNIPPGVLLKIAVNGSIAVWSEDESVEILSCSTEDICVEGYGRQILHIVRNGLHETRMVDFVKTPLLHLSLRSQPVTF